MSLYDKYFSNQNKNYIYNLLSDIIKEETNINIQKSEKYINLYRINYSSIFYNTDTDDIKILNKNLIDIVGNLIIKDISNTNTTNTNINNNYYDIDNIKNFNYDNKESYCIEIKNYNINNLSLNDKLSIYQLDNKLCNLKILKIIENYIITDYIKINDLLNLKIKINE